MPMSSGGSCSPSPSFRMTNTAMVSCSSSVSASPARESWRRIHWLFRCPNLDEKIKIYHCNIYSFLLDCTIITDYDKIVTTMTHWIMPKGIRLYRFGTGLFGWCVLCAGPFLRCMSPQPAERVVSIWPSKKEDCMCQNYSFNLVQSTNNRYHFYLKKNKVYGYIIVFQVHIVTFLCNVFEVYISAAFSQLCRVWMIRKVIEYFDKNANSNSPITRIKCWQIVFPQTSL